MKSDLILFRGICAHTHAEPDSKTQNYVGRNKCLKIFITALLNREYTLFYFLQRTKVNFTLSDVSGNTTQKYNMNSQFPRNLTAVFPFRIIKTTDLIKMKWAEFWEEGRYNFTYVSQLWPRLVCWEQKMGQGMKQGGYSQVVTQWGTEGWKHG